MRLFLRCSCFILLPNRFLCVASAQVSASSTGGDGQDATVSTPVACRPWRSWAAEAWTVIQIFSWHHRDNLEYPLIGRYFHQSSDWGNPSAISENLFWFQGYFSFKLLENLVLNFWLLFVGSLYVFGFWLLLGFSLMGLSLELVNWGSLHLPCLVFCCADVGRLCWSWFFCVYKVLRLLSRSCPVVCSE